MAETKSNLIADLSAIQNELKTIEKDGKNTQQHFDYVSEAQVKAILQKKLSEHGIQIIPSYEIVNLWTDQTSKGYKLNYASVLGEFVITNGQEQRVGRMPGVGMDSGDKAIYKAETGAQKNFLMQLFLMSTGDDPEKDNSNNRNTPAPRNNLNNHNNVANEAKKKVIKTRIAELAKTMQMSVNDAFASLQKQFPNLNFQTMTNEMADQVLVKLNQDIKDAKDTLEQMQMM